MTDKEKKEIELILGCVFLHIKDGLLDRAWDVYDEFEKQFKHFIDSLQEEPVSEELEEELDSYIKDNFTIDKEQLDRFGLDEKDYMYSMDKSDMLKMVRHFTELKHKKDVVITEHLIATAFANGMADMKQQMINAHGCPEEPVSEDLEKVAYTYACKCPPLKTSYGETSPNPEVKDAVIYGANWQKQQMMKDAISANILTNQYGNKYIQSWSGLKQYDKYKNGDEVKLIIIKKE